MSIQSPNFEQLIYNCISPNTQLRQESEKQINMFYEGMGTNELNMLFQIIANPNQNFQIKMYVSLIIKKFMENKVNSQTTNLIKEYFGNNLKQIIQMILTLQLDYKILNILILSFDKGFKYYEETDDAYYKTIAFGTIQEIFNNYNMHKSNQNLNMSIQCLFAFFKYIKYSTNTNGIKREKPKEPLFPEIFDTLINDFNALISLLLNNQFNQNNQGTNEEVILGYLIIYLKLFRYCIIFLSNKQIETIMKYTYQLVTQILNILISTTNKEFFKNSKNIFELIFLSNKILITYTSLVDSITTETLVDYTNMFYVYIKEENVFSLILETLKNSKNPKENKEKKFIMDILDIFTEFLDLSNFSEFTHFSIFGDCFGDQLVAASDYLRSTFFSNERLENLIKFTIKYGLVFKPNEIEEAKNDTEEFFLNYVNFDNYYQLRPKAQKILRILFGDYLDTLQKYFDQLKNDLIFICNKEFEYLKNNQYLPSSELNLKCGLLFYQNIYESFISAVDSKFIETCLLPQIDVNFVRSKGEEIFSTFITIGIFSNILSYKYVNSLQKTKEIFFKIGELFLINGEQYLLLQLRCIDFFIDFFDEQLTKLNFKLSEEFVYKFTIKTCELLKITNNPDIHSKIFKCMKCILEEPDDNVINNIFPNIYPIIKSLWNNNWNDYLNSQINNSNNIGQNTTVSLKKTIEQKSKCKLGEVKKSLFLLLSILIEKIGICLIDKNDVTNSNLNVINTNSNFFTQINPSSLNEDYLNFLYTSIGYSISLLTNDSNFYGYVAFNLILQIQDCIYESTPLKITKKLTEANFNLEQVRLFNFLFKLYDYVPIILDNLNSSEESLVIQFFILEQFFSFSFSQKISGKLEETKFIEKIIYILTSIFEKQFSNYSFFFFNICEYFLLVLLKFSAINQDMKNLYVNFIYNLTQKYLGNNFEYEIEGSIKLINEIKAQISLLPSNGLLEIEKKKEDYEHQIVKEKDKIAMLFGMLQLTNRLIYENAVKNIFANDVNLNISRKLIFLDKFVNVDDSAINVIQKKIYFNCVYNLKTIIKQTDLGIYNEMNNIYNKKVRSESLDFYEKNAEHWLYYFNKISNSNCFLLLNKEEQCLKDEWITKMNKINQYEARCPYYDFKIKLSVLASDSMFSEEGDIK